MDKPVIKVKWIESNLKQIEIAIRDSKEPSRIVYPKPENCDEAQYEYARGEFFYRVRKIFERLYGEHSILSSYGILKDDSDVLAILICWPRDHQIMDDGNISVDNIPRKVRDMLIENVRQMALGWKLSDNIELDVEPMAAAFARFEVDNYIWLFNFEVPTRAKSLLSINKDALELEWYEFNHDENKRQEKLSALADDEKGVGSYLAKRWMMNVRVNLQIWENRKDKHAMKGE